MFVEKYMPFNLTRLDYISLYLADIYTIYIYDKFTIRVKRKMLAFSKSSAFSQIIRKV